MLKKRRRERKGEKKVTEFIKKNRYKIDNKYQKAKIKNLDQSLELQKYNVKEKKKKRKRKIMKEKKKGHKNYKKYIYEVCFKKNRVFFFAK